MEQREEGQNKQKDKRMERESSGETTRCLRGNWCVE